MARSLLERVVPPVVVVAAVAVVVGSNRVELLLLERAMGGFQQTSLVVKLILPVELLLVLVDKVGWLPEVVIRL